MKVLIINASPRKGNTFAAVNAFAEGVPSNNEIEILEAYKYNISPCRACLACENKKGCIAKDDTNLVIDKIEAADVIIFATPVYWWGMSAQLKLIVDKFYCKQGLLKGKKIGVIAIGASPVSNVQYELIHSQFDCIAKYLGADIFMKKSYSAGGKDELQNNAEIIAELKSEGAIFQ